MLNFPEENVVSLNEKCVKCGADEWAIIDNVDSYMKFCNKCLHYVDVEKKSFLSNYKCDKCNCLEGTLEENDQFLAVRCKNCNNQNIVLEKKTTIKFDKPVSPTIQKRCPQCGGTEFTPVRKKYSFLTGFLTNKVDLICNKCGTKVK